MAYPNSGLLKIYPSACTIGFNAQYALNSDATPQPSRLAADLDAYYNARVTNLAVAPCLCRNIEKPAASGVYVPFGNSLTYDLTFNPSQIGFEFYNSYPGAIQATKSFLNASFPNGNV